VGGDGGAIAFGIPEREHECQPPPVTPLQRVALQLCSPQLSLEYGESGLELDVDAELIGEEHDIGGLPALARGILEPNRKRWVGARADDLCHGQLPAVAESHSVARVGTERKVLSERREDADDDRNRKADVSGLEPRNGCLRNARSTADGCLRPAQAKAQALCILPESLHLLPETRDRDVDRPGARCCHGPMVARHPLPISYHQLIQ